MRFWRNIALAALLVAMACAANSGAGQDWLPASHAVPGWSQEGEPRSFTRSNLWQHIDGAADLFLSYGFRRLDTARYVKEGDLERSISVDVYDMGTPLQAFGIFRSEMPLQPNSLAVGAQGYSSDGLAAFWKGSCYIKLSAIEEDDAADAAQFAAAVDKRLTGRVELPPEFRMLPEAGRVAGSERYVAKDALGHKSLTNVISAEYRLGNAMATLHLAMLSAQKAEAAWRKLLHFEKATGKGWAQIGGVGQSCFAIKDASYGEFAAARSGPLLVIAASEGATRESLIGLVKMTVREAARKDLRPTRRARTDR